jgi:ferredoxin
MSKYAIQVITDNCTGCLRCQLACSDVYTKAFNPSQSRIRVTVTGADCMIGFSEDCTECGACADNCFFGALEKTRKEDEP